MQFLLIRGHRELSGHLGRKEGGQHWAYANLWFLRLNIVETFRKHFPDVIIKAFMPTEIDFLIINEKWQHPNPLISQKTVKTPILRCVLQILKKLQQS